MALTTKSCKLVSLLPQRLEPRIHPSGSTYSPVAVTGASGMSADLLGIAPDTSLRSNES